MIIDGNESVLDRLSGINKQRLEGYISCGLKKQEILSAFNVDEEKMENWCTENYGMNFSTLFEVVRQIARGEYLDTMKDLGFKGNPTAISIIDKVVNSDDSSASNGMVFNVNVKVENNDDKKCD